MGKLGSSGTPFRSSVGRSGAVGKRVFELMVKPKNRDIILPSGFPQAFRLACGCV